MTRLTELVERICSGNGKSTALRAAIHPSADRRGER
jgi:hypothetical protein